MDLFGVRQTRVLKTLRRLRLDALLVSDPVNVRYLTGFTGSDSWLLLTSEHCIALTDGRYTTQFRQQCAELELEVRSSGTSLAQTAARVINKLRLRSVGYEPQALSVKDFAQLQQELRSTEPVATTAVVENLRARKEPPEINALRQAVQVAQRAFEATVALLQPHWTEMQVVGELEYAVRRLGGEGCSFDPIVAVGPQAALPHATPGSTRLDASSVLLVDWGAVWEGYRSDLTRTLVTGRVLRKFARAYEAVLRAQQAAIEAIAPGVPCGEVHEAACRVLEQAGLLRRFTHSLGHGLGLRVHELPRLAVDENTLLESGMVVTVEPGVYFPDQFGIRIEDDVLVTPQGAEVLSSLPKQLDAVIRKF